MVYWLEIKVGLNHWLSSTYCSEKWAAQVIKVAPQAHAQLLLKILHRKRFLKPKKIIAPPAHAEVWRFEKYYSNWLAAQTALGYGTKPTIKTNYAKSLFSFENAHRLTFLGEERLYLMKKDSQHPHVKESRW